MGCSEKQAAAAGVLGWVWHREKTLSAEEWIWPCWGIADGERHQGCEFGRTRATSKQADQLIHRKVGLAKNISERPTLDIPGMMRDHDEQSWPCGVFQNLMTSRRVVDGKAAPQQRPQQATRANRG